MSTVTDAQRRRGLIAAIGCISVTGVGFGVTFPLLSTLLEVRGASAAVMDANFLAASVSTVALTPFAPRLLHVLGAKRTVFGCLVICVLSVLAFKATDDPLIWIAIRFLFGCAITGLFVVSEIWINQLATDANRGRIVGVYATFLSLGFLAGPATLRLTGFDGWLPFLAAAGVIAAAGAPALLAIGVPFTAPTDSSTRSLFAMIRRSPTPFLAVLVFGASEASAFHLLTIYGLRLGLTEEAAASALQALIIGYIATQFAIGALTKRVGTRRLLIAIAILSAIGAAFLPIAADAPPTPGLEGLFGGPAPALFYVLIFFVGGLSCGLYTAGLVMLGERFQGSDLAGANSAFILVYGLGSLLAPPLAHRAMDLAPPHGLAWFFAAIFGVYGVFALYRSRRS